jgi:hypothetical protein
MALYRLIINVKEPDLSKTRATVFCLTTALERHRYLQIHLIFQSSHLNLIFSNVFKATLSFPMVDALSLFSINNLLTTFSQEHYLLQKQHRFSEFSVLFRAEVNEKEKLKPNHEN